QPVQPSVPTRVAAPQRPAPSNAVAAAEVLRRAAAHLPSPHPVQWTIDTQGWVPTVQAPSVAHVVTALVEASAVKSEGRPVLVSARTWPGRLVVTISDRAEISLGELALGPQPQAVQTLIRQINAALVATPVANGQGTSTVLTVPIPPGMD
ncbi:MAG: hypothetical protein LBO75_03755, partial [Bifidobacteriaceae bacterium]|nr:hypothetical protein [Bifidobacteriaceae bacterium]